MLDYGALAQAQVCKSNMVLYCRSASLLPANTLLGREPEQQKTSCKHALVCTAFPSFFSPNHSNTMESQSEAMHRPRNGGQYFKKRVREKLRIPYFKPTKDHGSRLTLRACSGLPHADSGGQSLCPGTPNSTKQVLLIYTLDSSVVVFCVSGSFQKVKRP